ncbi:putative lipase atg15 [Vermiconidia calcicola]|uniref:Lipase atg15 n=1 Tax=Vermiconidia calcicola TaxID=1690605 RepID=A0ACC3MWY2_9PEZI|nr:putative lipase atg15 [Vermiconidia calcicola]
MLRFGNFALAFLLFTVAAGGHVVGGGQTSKEAVDPYLVLPPGVGLEPQDDGRPKDLGVKEFSLRHIYHHGSHQYPKLHRYVDVPQNAKPMVADEDGQKQDFALGKLRARAVSTNVQRMADRSRETVDETLAHVGMYGQPLSLPPSAWTVDEISGPNHTDKETVITFAKMAANAYVEEPGTGEWQDVKGGFNYTEDFGWQVDGLRGHIFADTTNKTVVIGLKGTSMAVFDGADTTGNDKLNDNLFGSCCCGQGGHWTWKTVCDCMTTANTCNATCVRQSLNEKNHYYWAAKDLYHNVTERYPNADIWFAGHSLGGVVSTLLGLTFGHPVMTYEAYPDALAASRLGLPTPPGYRIGSHNARSDVAIHHYGHTADPIFMGTCDSAYAACTIAGYALESSCHTGQVCQYDTVGDKQWRQSVSYHRIGSVITDVLEAYDDVPVCEARPDCTDCYKWKFFESNGTERTTSSAASTATTSRTRTRSETCKTPGWWGCLDESTTSSSGSSTKYTTTTITSTLSTSTCKTPGWFGCKDSTTISSTLTSTVTTPRASPAPIFTTSSSQPTPSSSTATCETPGWFGCKDPTSVGTPAPSTTTSPTNPASTTCTSKGFLGFCLDSSDKEEERWRGDLKV